MTTNVERRKKIKEIIVKRLSLKITPDDIEDDQPLFSKEEGSLRLDSLEALEILVGLEEEFGFTIMPGDDPRSDFYSVASLEKMVDRNEANAIEATA